MTTDDVGFREELVSLLPRLRRFALALTGRAEAAEDLLHSAVERALRTKATFQVGRRLDSWMFKIIQNHWIDLRRSAANSASESIHDGDDYLGEDGRDVVEARDDVRVVRLAFEELPREQRVVVTLVVLEGLSYAQTAETLGVPIGTIMSRLSRARSAMAARVEGTLVPRISRKN